MAWRRSASGPGKETLPPREKLMFCPVASPSRSSQVVRRGAGARCACPSRAPRATSAVLQVSPRSRLGHRNQRQAGNRGRRTAASPRGTRRPDPQPGRPSCAGPPAEARAHPGLVCATAYHVEARSCSWHGHGRWPDVCPSPTPHDSRLWSARGRPGPHRTGFTRATHHELAPWIDRGMKAPHARHGQYQPSPCGPFSPPPLSARVSAARLPGSISIKVRRAGRGSSAWWPQARPDGDHR